MSRRDVRASAQARRDALEAAVRRRPYASTEELARDVGIAPVDAYGGLVGLTQLRRIKRAGWNDPKDTAVRWIAAGPPALTDDELEKLIR